MALALSLASPGQDFDPQSNEWNGMSYLSTTAKEAEVTLQFPDTFSWESVGPTDVLFFANPSDAVSPDTLLNFVKDGGRMVIALDGGATDAVPSRFGLMVDEKAVIHSTYYRDHVRFPLLSADSTHFLWFNVREVILNHPVALRLDPGRKESLNIEPIIDFHEPGQFFAVEWSYGEGRALFLSDASILINEMQQRSYGSKQLTANVLRYYCNTAQQDGCTVLFVSPSATIVGEYLGDHKPGLDNLEMVFAKAVDKLNGQSARINAWLSDALRHETVLWGLLAVFVFVLFLLRRRREADRLTWLLVEGTRRSAPQVAAKALALRRTGADFRRPALVLVRRVVDRLEKLLPSDMHALAGRDSGHGALKTALERKGLSSIAEPVLRCLHSFHMVGTREEKDAVTWGPGDPVGYDTFQTVHSDWKRIESALNAQSTGGERNEL